MKLANLHCGLFSLLMADYGYAQIRILHNCILHFSVCMEYSQMDVLY